MGLRVLRARSGMGRWCADCIVAIRRALNSAEYVRMGSIAWVRPRGDAPLIAVNTMLPTPVASRLAFRAQGLKLGGIAQISH